MALGLTTLRRQSWAFEDDYLELERLSVTPEGTSYAPWATLVSPASGSVLGADRERQTVLIFGDSADDWIEYDRPQP